MNAMLKSAHDWVDQAKEQLRRGELNEDSLEQLLTNLRATGPRQRQHLLYLHAATPSIRAQVVGWAIHMAEPGSVTEIDPAATTPPYPSVHGAILDGWRVIHFPLQMAPFDDNEIDIIGYEFVLEKLEFCHDHASLN